MEMAGVGVVINDIDSNIFASQSAKGGGGSSSFSLRQLPLLIRRILS
jgi:hypothetical protein